MDDAVMFVGEPVTCRIEGGMARFEIRTGGRELRFAISANHFLASFAKSAEVARQWRGGSCEVIPIKRAG